MQFHFAKRGLVLISCLSAVSLAGCATQTPPLYYWGDLQEQEYGHLTGQKGPEEGIQALEKIREEAKAKGLPVPPGFNAHLGMLYGLTGHTDRFAESLQAEEQQFPESKAYIGFLLKRKQEQ